MVLILGKIEVVFLWYTNNEFQLIASVTLMDYETFNYRSSLQSTTAYYRKTLKETIKGNFTAGYIYLKQSHSAVKLIQIALQALM